MGDEAGGADGGGERVEEVAEAGGRGRADGLPGLLGGRVGAPPTAWCSAAPRAVRRPASSSRPRGDHAGAGRGPLVVGEAAVQLKGGLVGLAGAGLEQVRLGRADAAGDQHRDVAVAAVLAQDGGRPARARSADCPAAAAPGVAAASGRPAASAACAAARPARPPRPGRRSGRDAPIGRVDGGGAGGQGVLGGRPVPGVRQCAADPAGVETEERRRRPTPARPRRAAPPGRRSSPSRTRAGPARRPARPGGG